MSWVAVSGLRKTFPGDTVALDGISFALKRGEFFCVVGPTNAGKSTLLKTIAGLHRPDAGSIEIAGREVTALEPRHRRVSLLFQNIALFPDLIGYDNIAFPLRTAGLAENRVSARVKEVADALKIGHILHRHPRTFSGGEQQRVAIGRAIAHSSDLLMLDEPLTNLDARIRISLRIEFKALHRNSGQTMLYVTHDQVEAMSLSDRIAVIDQGRLQQIGTPDEVYHRPANRFVAEFMGSPPMNFLPARLAGAAQCLEAQGAGFNIPIRVNDDTTARRLPQRIEIGVRPESIQASPHQTAKTPIAGQVVWVERLGSRHILDVKIGESLVKVVVRPDHPIRSEGPAWFGFEARPEQILDCQTNRFIC